MYAAMQAAVDLNPRYKPANIMSVELDMPDRTTMDYEGPVMDARVQVWGLDAQELFFSLARHMKTSEACAHTLVSTFLFQAAVNEALEDEGDITVDMPEGDFLEDAMRRARREQKKSRDGYVVLDDMFYCSNLSSARDFPLVARDFTPVPSDLTQPLHHLFTENPRDRGQRKRARAKGAQPAAPHQVILSREA